MSSGEADDKLAYGQLGLGGTLDGLHKPMGTHDGLGTEAPDYPAAHCSYLTSHELEQCHCQSGWLSQDFIRVLMPSQNLNELGRPYKEVQFRKFS